MLIELLYVCLYCSGILFMIGSYYIYTHRNVIKEKYDKYILIKKHVEESTDKSNISNISMVWIAISILTKFVWMFFISKIQRWVDGFLIKEISPDHFTIKLCIKRKIIKINLKIKRGPSDVIQVLGDDETDITDEIQPYFNYTYLPIKEKDFNFDKIDFFLVNGEVYDLESKLKKN